MAGNPVNFHIENRTKMMLDVSRSWMFNAIFPSISKVAGKSALPFGPEDLIVRCKSITIPDVSIDEISTQFMGTEQFFPGKKHTGGDVTATFFETEDQQIERIFYEWHQKIVNMDPDNDILAGGSSGSVKRDICSDIIVQGFKYNKVPMPFSFKLYNCWVKSVSNPTFDFSSTEGTSITVTFKCDYWKLVLAGSNLDYAAI